jgi:hypothetical protein
MGGATEQTGGAVPKHGGGSRQQEMHIDIAIPERGEGPRRQQLRSGTGHGAGGLAMGASWRRSHALRAPGQVRPE